MAEFLLVHGAWHGSWCWDDLIPFLAARGHAAHVMDLPGLGDDRTPLGDVTLDAYISCVTDRVKRIDRPLWLVGHSMAGIPITQAAEGVTDNLKGLIYVTAFIPAHGQSLIQLAMADSESRLNAVMVQDQANGTARVPEEHLRECFYSLCDERSFKKALARLSRVQASLPAITPVSLSGKLDRIPKFYVECLQDKAISIEAQRRMHRAATVARVTTLDSDHSPFFSCPDRLAALMDELVMDEAALR
ncbi:alpha/beta fold hydrolase [Bradyrhizobium mercantei]|uniref:alpha/beta fold hydrolase n=1 Tax=Bradyrhizobium mercantei TaxID=1904807 RepID=UPI000978BB25|nr:alpha/beta fold hydrolase [Bradyrhizobium mercantei]